MTAAKTENGEKPSQKKKTTNATEVHTDLTFEPYTHQAFVDMGSISRSKRYVAQLLLSPGTSFT